MNKNFLVRWVFYVPAIIAFGFRKQSFCPKTVSFEDVDLRPRNLFLGPTIYEIPKLKWY